jgi:magnesium transporter
VIEIKVLAAFVPAILGMGGNTGTQASAVAVRSIAMGEIKMSKLMRVFSRELLVGMMMGLVCGGLAAVIVWINLRWFGGAPGCSLPRLATAVGVSMCCAMTFAAFAGTALPIFFHRFNIDPALASGPFVSTSNDLSASLIYFLMCYMLLKL